MDNFDKNNASGRIGCFRRIQRLICKIYIFSGLKGCTKLAYIQVNIINNIQKIMISFIL